MGDGQSEGDTWQGITFEFPFCRREERERERAW
jgi:hypothetical protein